MLQPLKQFICDTCGQVIENIDHGYVEWANNEQHKALNFLIVHHKLHSPNKQSADGCYQINQSSLALGDFLDENGPAKILKFLDLGPIISPNGVDTVAADLREYVEFMRRLMLPYYEEARQYFKQAESDGEFYGFSETAIYIPSKLKSIIEKYDKQ